MKRKSSRLVYPSLRVMRDPELQIIAPPAPVGRRCPNHSWIEAGWHLNQAGNAWVCNMCHPPIVELTMTEMESKNENLRIS
jgi:hypothetical protein